MKTQLRLQCAMTLALTAVAPAFAQVAPAPPRAPEAADQSAIDNAGDIIVTAQRRSERTQDVPITITTIGPQAIRDANVQQLSDIVKLSPATRFDYQANFVQPTIRGVGTAVVSSGANSNVGIYIDGFYSPAPTAGDFQLLNVDTIQVLKGPQGTLFGRNTTGGAILVSSLAPSTVTSGIFQASYGSFNTADVKGYVTTGLSDRIAVALEGSYRRSDGYAHNAATDGPRHPGKLENWAVRAGLKFELSDSASLLLRYAHNAQDDGTNLSYGTYRDANKVYAPQQYTPTDPANPTAGGTLTPYPSALIPTGYRQAAAKGNAVPEFRFNGDVFQLTGNFDVGFGDLTTFTQYRNENSRTSDDQDQTLVDINYTTIPIKTQTFTQEFLVTSKPGGPLQWTTGVFYYNFTDLFDHVRAGTTPSTLFLDIVTHSRTQSIAAYADVTYQLGDHFFLTGGARYSYDRYDRGLFDVKFAGFPLVHAEYGSLTGGRVTPRAVLRYEIDGRSSAYASFTRGYKSGLIDVLAGGKVKPEIMDAFEVGYKYASRKFSLNLSSWYYNYKDLQLSIYPGGLSQILNAATARIYGVEGDVRYQVTPDFQFTAAAAYVDAKYKKFADASRYEICDQVVVSCASGTEGQYVTTDPTTNPYDASGKAMQRAPKFTATVGARYGFALAGGRTTLSGNLYHTSSFYFDPAQQFQSKGYELLGLRAEWTSPSDTYSIAVYADNVTGTRYYSQVVGHTPSIGAVWGAPRSIGASIRAKF